MRRAKLAAIAAVVVLGAAAGGRAYGYFTAPGGGEGTATVDSAEPLALLDPLDDATADRLYPGGEGDLLVRVQNPNRFAVVLERVRPAATDIRSDARGCAELVGLVDERLAIEPAVRVEPGATVDLRLPRAVRLDASAPDGCQGATFAIPVRVESATVAP